MKIRVNEGDVEISDGTKVGQVRDVQKPGADVLICNGFPAAEDTVLREGDDLVFIRRGERPGADELEALLVARHTPGVHQSLKRGRVGIAGLGGLGSAVALALARSGVGSLVLADFDVVEPSNLNRQQFSVGQIGMAKSEALRTNVLEANPYVEVRIETVELTGRNVPALFDGVQVLVEAFDRADAKAMLIDAALTGMKGVPVVSASGVAGFGPANAIVTRRLARDLFVVGDGTSEAMPGQGLMAPRVGVAAGHQANAVLRLLLGEDPLS